ncbi:cbb3-type cytochrome oxidase assembly protein CcoS [Pontibacter sp. BT310]|uniref:Cbb3-type cytochrome oxidase assembly protein CcoS n=1 Tax=Pontibacter populi TaxID=890055 RepID=A0ABS6XF51_9BACT|nr:MULTISPECIES: cbb3-type cytochrome oxidase assembly protein CcoS [Pontibacter]MBJ6119763.1 cbb3-type cytochrome oxidase assembly protein CcoS [Pontibacter sp. BT310]MBR0572192.1 cbb3-type cytochrome oxidase assembly protein CcoS [Microvirga sp. STS03]MBW3366616.1 cbb3-type cytochrome oxidase assembly protein CcoS [Pontibacter populi]
MYIIFLMIAVSVTVATAFLLAFLWAVRSGQYDDDYTPAVRMLFDNEVTTKSNKKTKEEQSIEKSLQS